MLPVIYIRVAESDAHICSRFGYCMKSIILRWFNFMLFIIINIREFSAQQNCRPGIADIEIIMAFE